MAHRYYARLTGDGFAVVSGSDSQHLCRVLRQKAGDSIIFCDNSGNDYEGEILEISSENVLLKIAKSWQSTTEANIFAHMYLGITKGDKLEWAIQKSVELGCASITPFYSRYTVVKPKKDEEKLERYRRIAKEAAKQSGRGKIPDINMALKFPEMLKDACEKDYPLFFYEKGGGSLKDIFNGINSENKSFALISGPEGGFSPEEAAEAEEKGCITASLGKRILRAETAPVAALAATMILSGNM